MSEQRPSPASIPEPRPGAAARFERISAGNALFFCLVPSIAGVACAVALHILVLLPAIGVGSNGLTRMVRLGEHLSSGEGERHDRPRVCMVGDSVSVEGIDAAAVERGSQETWQARNYAINGATREQIRIILPKVLATKPDAVTYVLCVQAITDPPPLPIDLAYAYALGGFPSAWPDGWVTPGVPGVPAGVMKGLEADRTAAQLHFRGALVYRFNDLMHERFSGKTKLPPPDDWRDPHHLTASIVGDRLDRHLKAMEDEVTHSARMSDASFPATLEPNERDLAELVAQIRGAGATPVLVIAPVHPRLRDSRPYAEVGARLSQRVDEMVARSGAVRIDARLLLDEADFADALHPGPTGRSKLSEFIGSRLPPPASR